MPLGGGGTPPAHARTRSPLRTAGSDGGGVARGEGGACETAKQGAWISPPGKWGVAEERQTGAYRILRTKNTYTDMGQETNRRLTWWSKRGTMVT